MPSSVDGRGAGGVDGRTNRSRTTAGSVPGSTGFQTVAGASVAVKAMVRGPVRRSRYGAIDVRHVSAACWRSAGVRVIWTSFSASAKVVVVTSGPTPGPVPNVGGAPGVGDGVWGGAAGGLPLHASAAIRNPSGAVIRNCRR